MVDAILMDESQKAEQLLDQYLGLPGTKRGFNEETYHRHDPHGSGKVVTYHTKPGDHPKRSTVNKQQKEKRSMPF